MKGIVLVAAILTAVLIASATASGAVHVVKPDGTGDFPVIQDAIDAAANGDVIVLTDGTFTGVGNRDLDFKGKAITVRSLSGFPQNCILDAEGAQWIPQRVFDFQTNEGPDSIVRDITITGGSTDDC
jgi:hypothetical protein